ncbi:MAG: hypothetical protein WA853_15010 [Candidatus Acidiferrum sp.]
MQFESGVPIRMPMTDVGELEGVGGVFSRLIRLWKCVEKFRAPNKNEGHRVSNAEDRFPEDPLILDPDSIQAVQSLGVRLHFSAPFFDSIFHRKTLHIMEGMPAIFSDVLERKEVRLALHPFEQDTKGETFGRVDVGNPNLQAVNEEINRGAFMYGSPYCGAHG